MGGAILRAVLDSGSFPPERVHISSPVPAELAPFAGRGCVTGSDNRSTVRSSDLILLTVRPGQIKAVLEEIAPGTGGKCLLSIAAGASVAHIKEFLPDTAFVLRAMPNIPLAYGRGVTVLANPPDGVPERFADAAKTVFQSGGIVEVLDESLIDAATALGGSGVAYYFRMASVMSRWAADNGIHGQTAMRIILQGMTGAHAMLEKSGNTPAGLASSVATPGGMTEAAFRAFDKEGFDQALAAGMDACRDRARELM
jgi:pyrroline-5-carboxylate reductase